MAEGVHTTLNELIALRPYALAQSAPSKLKAAHPGNHQSCLRGRGMDFSEVRNYQAGDEIRHMEWRVTARTGRPHVKIYQEERERPVVILADFNPSMIFGTKKAFKSVVAAHLAALVAWTVIKQGDRIGGFFFSASQHSEFTPRSREAGVLSLLASLCHYTQQTEQEVKAPPRLLSDALIRLRRVLRPGSILVLISDFYSLDSESEHHLKRLKKHNDVLAYQVCDPLELSPPKPQCYPMTDGQQELLLDLTQKKLRSAYETFCAQREATLQEQFKRLQIQYLRLTAETDLARLVSQSFPRRKNGRG